MPCDVDGFLQEGFNYSCIELSFCLWFLELSGNTTQTFYLCLSDVWWLSSLISGLISSRAFSFLCVCAIYVFSRQGVFIISPFTAQHVSNVSTSIFRSLRLTVDLFHMLYFSGSMCVGVTVWFGWGGVVSLCRLKH